MNTQTAFQLPVQSRQLTGRKVRRLRKQGIIPGNVFGENQASTSIQVEEKQLMKLYHQAGGTQVIYLTIDQQKKQPVMIADLEFDPVKDTPLHVNFRRINLKEKVTAEVPIVLQGESEAAKQGGVLVQLLDHLEIEALPDKIPSEIEVDLSALTQIGEMITVADLNLPSQEFQVVTEPDQGIVKVEAPRVAEEETPAEAAEGEAEEGGEEAGEAQASESEE